ncbi:unnamed protein product [Polarella glacialis]|uniref:Uncharacterized protein n=1 Tax=Polarella glacialis TaxID=89957 RepID=A0A813G0C3_POLGL|nr:unnamed protein product [Polarella glacialis]
MDRPVGSETYIVKSTTTNPKRWKDTERQNCVLQKSALARKRQIYITFTRTGLRSGAETILRNLNLGQQSGDDPSQKPSGGKAETTLRKKLLRQQSGDDPLQKMRSSRFHRLTSHQLQSTRIDRGHSINGDLGDQLTVGKGICAFA